MRQARPRWLPRYPGLTVTTLGRPPDRARGGHDLLIRRSGRIAQSRPMWSVRWADLLQLSIPSRCCPPSWQQHWQQSRRACTGPRPSAFQAGHIQKLLRIIRATCAAASRCCLLMAAAVAVTVAVRLGARDCCRCPFGPGKTAVGHCPGVVPIVHCEQALGLLPGLVAGGGCVAGSGGLGGGDRWRVFVSHTSELRDFPAGGGAYVAAVERAIMACGHVVVDMAGFPAADQVPAEMCRERVRGCEVMWVC
jgi:hypothetical protein